MIAFRTGLVIQTESNKEFNLPETHSISCLKVPFTIDSKKEYLYSIEEGISVYTLNPLNKIKSIEYKKPIKEICAGSKFIYILNDDSLTFYSKKGFSIISNDFRNSNIQIFDKQLVGVQNKNELSVYDGNSRRVSVFRCQCSFSSRDILLIGFVTSLKAYVKSNFAFEVIMPAYITAIVTDNLFSRIYCATQDNNIYCYNLNGTPLTILEYHLKPVTKLRLSFCGKFLYSSDGTRICVWSILYNIVLGYIDIEEGIENFETTLVDDFNYNLNDTLI